MATCSSAGPDYRAVPLPPPTWTARATITKANAVDWPAHWAESSEAAAALAEVERLVAEGAAASLPLVMPSEYAQPFSVQVREEGADRASDDCAHADIQGCGASRVLKWLGNEALGVAGDSRTA
jgi:hypothetical protein